MVRILVEVFFPVKSSNKKVKQLNSYTGDADERGYS